MKKVRKFLNIVPIYFIPLLIVILTIDLKSKDSRPVSRYYTNWIKMDSLRYERIKDNDRLELFDTINIVSKTDFDSINHKIQEYIERGKTSIYVNFSNGKYFYKENHVYLTNLCNDSLHIIFDGNGSDLYGASETCRLEKNPKYTYFKKGEIYSPWSEVVQADDSIESINGDDGLLFRIKKIPSIHAKTGDLIQVSQWFRSSIYKITDVNNGYLFFDTEPIDGNYRDWNINYDLIYGKKMPRYRIYNTAPDNSLCQHTPVAFFSLTDSKVGKVSFLNFNFYGSALSGMKGVMNFTNSTSGLKMIKSCSFSSCNGLCIGILGSDNVYIDNCSFNNNSIGCIFCDDRCNGIQVTNSIFTENGTGWSNSFNVRLSGSQFVISNNVFSDFNYGAICVGDWWGNSKRGSVTGIVEFNEIFYTPEFYNDYKKHTLMDSGAIYVMTKNDDVHVRYNRIFNIIGMKDNRGIFCDDGTCNVKIYGNIITGIGESYSIDLWEAASIESKSNYDFGRVNVGNFLMYNFFDNDVRFEGRRGMQDNGCVKGQNFILSSMDNTYGKVKSKNIPYSEEDICFSIIDCGANGKIELSDSIMNELEKLPVFNIIQKWFNR